MIYLNYIYIYTYIYIHVKFIYFLVIIGHVQIAQVPDRHEPDTSGEIDYKYVLSILEKEGYDGYVGLEYCPKSSSVDGLSWIQKYGYEL